MARPAAVFDVPMTSPMLLPAGVLGVTVVVRNGGRQFRFALHGATLAGGGRLDAAETLTQAIRRAFDRDNDNPIVENVVIHLKGDSIHLNCQNITFRTLLALLRQLLANAGVSPTVPDTASSSFTISSSFDGQ